jgi:hypothetical protein
VQMCTMGNIIRRSIFLLAFENKSGFTDHGSVLPSTPQESGRSHGKLLQCSLKSP